MIHRDDAAGATARALLAAVPGEVYNVVDDEPVTQLEFFRWLSRSLERDLPPFESSTPTILRKRGRSNKRVSNRKLRLELGCPLKFPSYREGYAPEIHGLKSGQPGAETAASSGD
jgi:nucleoside-diphosphate-sugar epimerase